MHLAKVIGKVVSTQKSEKLIGAKLLMIKSVDENRNLNSTEVFVAIDLIGAGMDDIVLIDWGSSMYEDMKISADMSIVGIVDDLQSEEEARAEGGR
ncbi:EutN/CcmL family microcompartment protein [Paenibacillus sp. BR2-3]|uniref:EutN/CcmL family microcompartment protein n=1 Tax=Paenibacillus sp. BR2-3 TaxID=3048494 RepID=UPI003977C1BC